MRSGRMPPRATRVSPQNKDGDERAAASERCAGTVGRRERPAQHAPEPNLRVRHYRGGPQASGYANTSLAWWTGSTC